MQLFLIVQQESFNEYSPLHLPLSKIISDNSAIFHQFFYVCFRKREFLCGFLRL